MNIMIAYILFFGRQMFLSALDIASVGDTFVFCKTGEVMYSHPCMVSIIVWPFIQWIILVSFQLLYILFSIMLQKYIVWDSCAMRPSSFKSNSVIYYTYLYFFRAKIDNAWDATKNRKVQISMLEHLACGIKLYFTDSKIFDYFS